MAEVMKVKEGWLVSSPTLHLAAVGPTKDAAIARLAEIIKTYRRVLARIAEGVNNQ